MSDHDTVVSVKDVRVQFGAVKALDGVDLEIFAGETIGLVGHNGAGKSTIVNVINGALPPHEGAVSYGAQDSTTKVAKDNGVRCVFQELSLFPNLTIVENARLMHSDLGGWNWRKTAARLMREMLDEIFPNNSIQTQSAVGELSIAERQMVEIAIKFLNVTQAPKLVILDEPTSSLDATLAEQLLAHVRRYVSEGGSVLFISHILGEILSTSSRIVVMKDGKIVSSKPASEFSVQSLVETMGSVVKKSERKSARSAVQGSEQTVLHIPSGKAGGLDFNATRGEIVGLAGLGGHGQTEMLLDLFNKHCSNWVPEKQQNVAFVAGDRSLNGTFPLWSILRNLTVSNVRALARFATIDAAREDIQADEWKKRIEIRTPDIDNPILSLSGGNQQKVLFARALSGEAEIVLMDDPMRGVDIGTKQEVYNILQSEAVSGRTFIWYSTEMDEVCLCNRVYVFRDGAIVAELSGDDVTEDNILAASFSGVAA
ncbi:MAG: sugar ABC transporter ATP-binding protein [Rhodobacteraceae bacterium]|nr:sugar ABC transporter ATP-binding protein [Paracoccaceae bacterium]